MSAAAGEGLGQLSVLLLAGFYIFFLSSGFFVFAGLYFNNILICIFIYILFFIISFKCFLLGGCYKDEGFMQRYWEMIGIGIPAVKFPKNQEKNV